jgi:asparagine synthase (glutamine-hydrolysing)
MCGIAGWIDLDKSEPPRGDADAVLHSMCQTIVHRGPDSEGSWLDGRAALGMRRLSVIDLHTGEQPVFSEDRNVVVVMNGELYNYREVREELQKRGHVFTTKSDTEILPHLYEEYGDALVDHLNPYSRVNCKAIKGWASLSAPARICPWREPLQRRVV